MPQPDIESMPTPPVRKGPSQPTGSFSDMNRKLAIVEDRLENIRDLIALVENDSLEKIKALTIEVHDYDDKIDALYKELEKLRGMIERVVSKLELFAGKEQVKVLERYLNFWNPLDYVSKKDVEELVDEKLRKIKPTRKTKKKTKK